VLGPGLVFFPVEKGGDDVPSVGKEKNAGKGEIRREGNKYKNRAANSSLFQSPEPFQWKWKKGQNTIGGRNLKRKMFNGRGELGKGGDSTRGGGGKFVPGLGVIEIREGEKAHNDGRR